MYELIVKSKIMNVEVLVPGESEDFPEGILKVYMDDHSIILAHYDPKFIENFFRELLNDEKFFLYEDWMTDEDDVIGTVEDRPEISVVEVNGSDDGEYEDD
jgi:hypothetical protein